MSTVATAWAQKQTAGSAGRKATLLLLADVASEHGVLWAGIDYLAEILECNRTTIMDHLRRLQEDGLIARIERRKPNGARHGTITVLAPDGDRGSMRNASEHELHGQAIRDGLGRNFQRGDSEEPKSEIATTLGRESRPEPSREPSVNRATDANASVVAATPPADQVALEVKRLCDLMSSHLRTTHNVASSSREMKGARTWPGACRGLLTIDVCAQTNEHYTSAQVEYAIAFVCRSQYWRGRVKSMTRLRQEMPEIAKELHEKRARRDGGAQQDPLAGLSPEQRARMQRTAERAQRAYADRPPTPSGELNAPDHNVRSLAAAC